MASEGRSHLYVRPVPLGAFSRDGQQAWVLRRAGGTGAVLVYDVGSNGVRLRPAAARCKPS